MNRKKRIDFIIYQLASKKTQLMAAGVMLALTAGPIASAYFYVPKTVVDVQATPAAILPESTWAAETTLAAIETTAAEEDYQPTPGELNLAYYFPEGADPSKKTESLAGEAFKVLMTHDESWISGIYDMADATPLQMATALGQPRSSVLGTYNYKEEEHDIKNPDSWTINSFKKVRMSFVNGDGQAVSAFSNVIDIMSMANLYTYFKDAEDYDLFLTYAKELWDKSHSYTSGISQVYYCSGCLDEDAERQEYEELEAEAKAEEEAGYAQTSESGLPVQDSSPAPSTETGTKAEVKAETADKTTAETTSTVIIAGMSVKKETAATLPPETAPPVPESTSGVIVAGQTETAAEETTSTLAEAASKQILAAAAATVAENMAIEEIAMAAAGETDSSMATPADAIAEDSETLSKKTTDCPGHIDLIVNVKVIGLDEENGLFQRDTIGNDRANIEDDGWPGWNNYTMASARLLSNQDWFAKYGLSLSVISMRNPLSEAEIESYLNQLPVGLSQTRKDLITFALSSVGKVPYYWGGKPSVPNYAGNSFGILMEPDVKGRILRGLDCSGWINWVYWSVTGQRLAYESTSGLAISGSKIKRSELQPGDIIVRTGDDAHVIMFLGWTADGKIRCIHESSAGVNNVTVAIRDANWPYYRALVD